MADLELMTYLAKPADPNAPDPHDGNLAIQKFDEVFKRANAKYGMGYERVASLLDIAKSLHALNEAKRRPETIQIVGHGAPGMLALGYYWNPRYTDSDTGPFYLLDSNPYTYGILEPFVRPPTRVVLAGCYVGSNHNSYVVARGSALIFDLRSMWGCDVTAADEFVGPDHFNEHGRYVGSALGYVHGRWVKVPGIDLPKLHNAATRGMAPASGSFPFSDVALAAIPCLGGSPFKSFVPGIATASISDLVNGYSRELDITGKPPIMAMHEVSFHATDLADRKPVELHLICNSQFMKVVKPKPGTAKKVRLFTTQEKYPLTIDALYEHHTRKSHPGYEIWKQITEAMRDRTVAAVTAT